jgi:hypothetical protein
MASAAALITAAAAQYGVPSSIALGVATRESDMNQNIPNGAAGEIGMFQVMPSLAASMGLNPSIESQNIQCGVTYLAQLYGEFGDWGTAVAAYNWGPENVSNAIAQNGPNWLFSAPSSTQSYVEAVVGVSPTQEAELYGSAPSTGLAPLAPDTSSDETIYTDSDTEDDSGDTTDSEFETGLIWAGVAVAAGAAYLIGENI